MKDLIITALKKNRVFNELKDHEDFDCLDDYIKYVNLNQGDVLFSEKDEGGFLSFIIHGQVEIVKKSIQDKQVKIAILNEYSCVGEMSIIDKLPRSATVLAAVPTHLLELTKENFNALLEKHPILGIKLLRGIARSMSFNLRRASNQLSDCLPPIL
ncbi:MAG: cyclic nucleotide-binding domain-containing protein [Gammaproteobacteria bacterium]|nr:cyclic nucleotide-binding domain-containing protein [Gammaproteobacteria bacterium]